MATAARKNGRGKGWCADSVAFMLDQVEALKPLGRNGWLKVERAFKASEYPPRDADALKRKFVSLKNHPKPTGDPDCPPDVIRAKRICREIDNHVSVLPLCDDPDILDDESSGENMSYSGDDLDYHEVRNEMADDSYGQEKPNRTGVSRNELIELSKELRKNKSTTASAGSLSYTAKKRQSLDKFIDGMSRASNESSDFMSMLVMMDERAAEREERRRQQEEEREARRLEREYQWQSEQMDRQVKADEDHAEKERRRDGMLMALMSKLFGLK
ncbi:hypothetical protein LEN26_019449 [Aphanomyces euteiches]|nr:hypothetical protein LEN26_019449 [Aphanomyces euteiches]KAH9123634.1 hypothetical protein AeMF1_005431 [Aphanomyces euteiches]